MQLDYKKMLAVAVLIILFGVFVYPTLYKYDKLDQKYPVKINRITGETKVLYRDGWRVLGDSKPEETIIEPIVSAVAMSKESMFKLAESKSEILDISTKEVEIEGFSISRFHVSSYNVTGEIMNNSDKEIISSKLKIELFDKDGNVLPDQPSEISLSLGIGESTIFTKYSGARTQDVGKYRVILKYSKYNR